MRNLKKLAFRIPEKPAGPKGNRINNMSGQAVCEATWQGIDTCGIV